MAGEEQDYREKEGNEKKKGGRRTEKGKEFKTQKNLRGCNRKVGKSKLRPTSTYLHHTD